MVYLYLCIVEPVVVKRVAARYDSTVQRVNIIKYYWNVLTDEPHCALSPANVISGISPSRFWREFFITFKLKVYPSDRT